MRKFFILFNLLLWTGIIAIAQINPKTIVPLGSSWKYLDNGSNQGTAWYGTGFSDAAWASGNAQLGYGDGDEATVVSYGPSSSAKYITTYFRKTITVTDASLYGSYTLNVRRDDGIVVYINGVEVYRDNMPAGGVAYNTGAASTCGDDGGSILSATLPAGTLVTGTNVIAVEIHQVDGASSDISFDLGLYGNFPGCQGGTSAGTITPNCAWQTIPAIPGNPAGTYYTFNGIQGLKYTFSFCQGGGTAAFDTELTILYNTNVLIPRAHNDNNCGNLSEVSFTPPTTDTYRVLITQSGCIANPAGATLAYRTWPIDEPCSALYLNPQCQTATSYSASTSCATATSGIPSPGCASYTNGTDADVWFKTLVPYGNNFTITSLANQITNSGMAVYKAASCAGPFTLISCNDDISGVNLMSSILLNNNAGLAEGDSIFIRFWAKNNAQTGTFGIYIVDNNKTYCTNGDATLLDNTACLRMNQDVAYTTSAFWGNTKLDLTQTLNYTFFSNFGNDDVYGADGITFTIQNAASGQNTIGAPGSSLGISGVAKTVSIEFDTFDNGGASEMAADHTAISVNGNLTSPVAGPIQASSTSANIEDGLNHTINIQWTPAPTNKLDVYFDGNLRLTYTNDIVANVFTGTSSVYWGFTSSTGRLSNTQVVCPNNLPGVTLPVIYNYFLVSESEGNVLLNWGTSREYNVSEYVIESSRDGLSFYPIGNVVVGNSGSKNQYQFVDTNPRGNKIYYRINEIDKDGKNTFSEVRFIDLAGKAEIELYPNPAKAGEVVVVRDFTVDSEDNVFFLYDNVGRVILSGNVDKESNIIHLPASLTDGLYHLQIHTSSQLFMKKLQVYH